jgi:glycerophosphoryl diester phosphodiesterase
VLGSPGSPLPTRGARHTDAIATIAQVLELAKRTGAVVNLEIKNVPTDPDYDSTPAYANRVMDAVIQSKLPRRQLIIQSFVPEHLDVARQRLPGVRTSLLSLQAVNEAFLQLAADKDCDFISPEWPVSGEYVGAAHYSGLKVVPFTLDARRQVRDAKKDGVDALITDDPLMAGRALGLCEFFFSTRRTPASRGAPTVTIRFNGNAHLLPQLDGPERARLKRPDLSP